MTQAAIATPAAKSQPGAPHDNFSQPANSISDCKNIMNCQSDVSTGATGTETPNTNSNSGLCIHNTNTTLKKRRYNVYVSELHWKSALQKARELGYSLSELINAFIISIVDQTSEFPSKTPLNFNVAIAKAESKPVINIGEYIALKQLDDILAQSRKLRDRAEREQDGGQVLTFTKERAKSLEESLLRALKGLKSLPPEKLQEVEAALKILKGIREGRA